MEEQFQSGHNNNDDDENQHKYSYFVSKAKTCQKLKNIIKYTSN